VTAINAQGVEKNCCHERRRRIHNQRSGSLANTQFAPSVPVLVFTKTPKSKSFPPKFNSSTSH
jgi:hypothetical protein